MLVVPERLEVVVDDSLMDAMARMTRRIDRLERKNRRWKRIHAVLLVGMAAWLIGTVDRTTVTGAQQDDRPDESLSAFETHAETRIKIANRALKSIEQRVNAGTGVLNRDSLIHAWSQRLVFAQIDRNDAKVPQVDIFAGHLNRMKQIEDRANAHYRERRISDLDQMEATYFRSEAESWVVRAKTGLSPSLFSANR
jgi:hypothetical protein